MMRTKHGNRGVTLIELMIGMVIGLLILAAISTVYLSSRATARTNESIARMQEYGRLALDLLATHLGHAGYYGRTSLATSIIGRTGASGTLATAADNDCGAFWYLDLTQPVWASDNANPFSATCIKDDPGRRQWLAATDLLAVRNAVTTNMDAVLPPDFRDGQLYIRGDLNSAQLFIGDTAPALADFGASAETHAVNSYVYYVADHDPDAAGNYRPALMRAQTTREGTVTQLENHEVMPYIQDFQVELGLDTNLDSDADVFVAPAVGTDFNQAVAVRIWILVRAEEIDTSFNPSGSAITYTLGPASATFTDSFRRVAMTRTIRLRNINQARQ